MSTDPACFTWYELLTTDMAAATKFYGEVVGWTALPSTTSRVPYTLFKAGDSDAAGLLELPPEGLKVGARPRWMGYVGVSDVNAAADQTKRLGGVLYVPPTDANIGRIAVLADAHGALFALIAQPQVTVQRPADSARPGRFGWNELFSTDLQQEGTFYRELFNWEPDDTEDRFTNTYLTFLAGGHVVAGALKNSDPSPPFWLFYINVEDIDAAVERVGAAGGRAGYNDTELPGGMRIAYCSDPQGATFALQGKRTQKPQIGWTTEWQGFSSRGQLVAPKKK
ncbi:MAG TPA: VOC family protein [Bradyrhizobium sp.]|uniref:VOC family protein n=1 Tax=Bradyrhizobium sp. TaxID=376 RepID=UPI002D7EFEA1|nr:VOC family protein [Bradyrhizobium sp.]HET7889044.1 VOC family protein [Bradyrhizobium sp.]